MNFDFMDPPSAESLIKALNLLYAMGGLSETGGLTKTGKKMAEFPIDPMLSKMIIESAKYGCVEEIISISAMLQVQNAIFYYPKEKKIDADRARTGFFRPGGDHISLLNIWEQVFLTL